MIVTTTHRVWTPPAKVDYYLPWTDQSEGDGGLAFALVTGPDPEARVTKTVESAIADRGMMPLRPYQEECIEAVFAAWKAGKKAPLVVMATGCHRAGQGVMMYDGSIRKVEDVRVGDVLMGPDSTPRNVLALCRGEGPMFEIRPKKGCSWVVNDEHVLSLTLSPTGKQNASGKPLPFALRTVEDVTVSEYLRKNKTWKHRAHLYRATAVSFGRPSVQLPVDPYFIGLYLADGTMANERVEVSKPDDEVKLCCEEQARIHGLSVRMSAGGSGCPSWHIIATKGERNPLLDKLRQLGMMQLKSEDRFIPEAYLYAPIEARAAMLAGMLDGDGHLGNGGYDYISKSMRLAHGLVFVARSLGLAAYVKGCRKKCQGGFVGSYWRVSLSGDFSALPMRIPRKKAAPRRQVKNVLNVGFDVLPVGTTEPYFGFVLDGDRRYLLDDFTVTHNSGKTVLATEIMRRFVTHGHQRPRALFIAHREELLKQTYDTVRALAPTMSVGIIQGKSKKTGMDITIASRDTIARPSRLLDVVTMSNEWFKKADKPPTLVIIDEAHHATSRTYQTIINGLRTLSPDMMLLGLTATPGRADGTALDSVFDCIPYERNAFQLLQDGYLVPPVGFDIRLDLDFDSVGEDGEDYKTTSLSKVMNKPAVVDAIVRGWMQFGQNRKMLCFCVDVAHSNAVAEAFSAAGYPAAAVYGEMKKERRNELLTQFRNGALRILTSCDVLSEGYDDPSAEGVIMARPTQSQALYIQQVGRALRLYPGKVDALVLDCVGNATKHPPVQLATLAGLNQIRQSGVTASGAAKEDETPDVSRAEISGTEINFGRLRRRETRYAWRETKYGWTVNIPRIGYFLVAWADETHTMANIRFHDTRPGHRNTPPITVNNGPIEFEMAYGLVESELERIMAARASRARAKDVDNVPRPVNAHEVFQLIEDGLSEELFVPESHMLNDADWRSKPITERQRDALVKLGVKERSIPATAGEAGDLITVLSVEKDAKLRESATPKQIAYIMANKLPLPEGVSVSDLTKGQAAKIIFPHRKAIEARGREE